MARYWGQQKEESLITVGGGSENLQGISASDRKRWDSKQDQLVYDNKPMRGSVNVLNSDAIARAFEEFKDAISTAYKQYLSTQVTSYAEMVTAVTNAKNDVDNAYAAIEKYETNMRVLYEDTLSKLTDAQNIIAGATTLLNKTNTESSALSEKIKQLESAHSSVISDLNTLRSALAEVSNDASGAQVRIEELIAKANDVDAQVVGLVKTVEDALTEIETEKEDALANIRAVRDSIPDDYEKVCEDIKEVRQELIDARRRGTWITSETLSGETVHATDCAHIPPRNIKVFGKSIQESTSGNQLFDIRKCRNLTGYGITFAVDGEYLSIKGTGEIGYMAYDVDCEISAGTTVYLYITEGDATNLTYYLRDSDGGLVSAISKDGSATPSKDVGRFRIVCDTSTYNTKLKIMLTSKENANYEPYTGGKPSPSIDYPQDIQSLGSGGSIGGKVLTGNVLKYSYPSGHTETKNGVTFTILEDGGLNFVGTNTIDGETSFNIIRLNDYSLPNGTYTISCKGTNANIQCGVWNNWKPFFVGNSITFTSDKSFTGTMEDCEPIMSVFIKPNATVNTTIYTMLNVGKEPLPYEPYTEQPFTVLTPNGLPGIPVSILGNYTDSNGQQWVADYVDFERGKYVKRVNKAILTDDRWFQDGQTDEYGYSFFFTENARPNNPYRYWLFCNHAQYASKGDGYCWEEGKFTTAGNNAFEVKTNKTLDEWKDYVKNLYDSGNPIVVYFIVDPIEIDLTQEEIAQYQALCMNYPNTTIINDAGAYMEVEYGKDAEAYINENYTLKSEHEALKQRVKIIEEEIIKL